MTQPNSLYSELRTHLALSYSLAHCVAPQRETAKLNNIFRSNEKTKMLEERTCRQARFGENLRYAKRCESSLDAIVEQRRDTATSIRRRCIEKANVAVWAVRNEARKGSPLSCYQSLESLQALKPRRDLRRSWCPSVELLRCVVRGREFVN